MVNYCGTDIIEVNRVKDAIESTKGFRGKVYTKLEIDVGNKKGEAVRYEYYAGRFAAKEAIYKSLSKIDSEVEFKQIEILNNKEDKNRPIVRILKQDLLVLQENGTLKIDVSISHIKEYATAMAVVEYCDKK